MYIVASNDINTQIMKLKNDVSLAKAKMILQNLIENDYLGFEYWLEDNNGNMIDIENDEV